MSNKREQRANLAGSNMFELLLFRLGASPGTEQRDLYGINVFKVREIVALPAITAVAGAGSSVLGVVDVRGQIIPVIDLAAVTGCKPKDGPKILLITEFARSTQGFAVEEVDEIARLQWDQVLSAEAYSTSQTVTSFARLDGNVEGSRLAQVLDVEQILRDVLPAAEPEINKENVGGSLRLPAGTRILAADDSAVARALIEQSLEALGVPFVMTKTGKQAWDYLEAAHGRARKNNTRVCEEIALVLTDLEMPEMDGFTLTRQIKSDGAYTGIPVVIHSSLSGTTNEELVRKVGADAYVSKFVALELAAVLRTALGAARAAQADRKAAVAG